jgi:dipeptidyl aminopeptidase/acylaminoacyl peptidase
MHDPRPLAAALALVAACATPKPAADAPKAAPPTATAAPAATAQPASAASAAAGGGAVSPTERTPAEQQRDAELAQRAAAVVDAFQNRIFGFGGLLSHDGKRVIFGSNREGSPQLYVGDVASPSAPPRRLTPGAERVQTATLSRDGKWVLFTRDRGADENSHIYRVPLDGGEPVDLTPGEGVRFDPPVLPLQRPDLMVFGKRSVKSPASTILVEPIAGGEPRTVYEDPAPTFLSDASPDGSRALALRAVSASELVLLEIDVAKPGAARRVWPAEGRKEAIAFAVYATDGRTAFVATDQGGEEFAVLAVDLKSLQVKARWTPDPATALVDQMVVAPAGDVIAVRVNAGNREELRLLETATLRQRAKVDVPLGSGDVGEFTPDGRSLAVAMSTPDSPGEPYVVDAATGKARRVRADERKGGSALAQVETSITSIPAFDGKPIPVHTYLPKGRAGQKLPVIVEFHGGPSASSVVGWKTRAQFFVGQGYAWVEPNMRGSTGFGRAWEMADNREKRGDVLKDMASVNAWVKAQPWADANRVVLFGGSYGGWVVLEGLTRQQRLWNVGIDLVGVADLRTLLRSTDQLIRAVFVDEFGDLEKDEALLAEWSPLRDADKIAVPLFVYQGQNDPRVPRAESDAIVRALRGRNVPVEYMIAANEGHSLDRRENQIEFFARSARFLEEHLGARGSAGGAAQGAGVK